MEDLADLLHRAASLAADFRATLTERPVSATGTAAGGATIANDVVLNQVLVDFGDDARSDRVVEAVPPEGTCWLGAPRGGGAG